ncbi:MAG: dihydropteroate synthase [Clostridia bacterium]|jgi:hypothetical protein|nr:dihydropteroate synthase [Clostridia bacterium]MDN5321670.1 dihydropteroate synthase [Clostridia bacterium]
MPFNVFYCGPIIWDARPWLEKTKSDEGGIIIMERKASILPIYVENIYCGAANILKQEMLSLGGEVAIHKYAINCKEEFGDVLILGTLKHYKLLQKKLAAQHWKLKELGQEIKIVINNILFAQKQETKKLSKDEYQQMEKNVVTLIPTGDLIEDVRDLPIIDHISQSNTIIHLVTEKLKDFRLLEQYIVSLQSKGYKVLINAKNYEMELLVGFFRTNYIFK